VIEDERRNTNDSDERRLNEDFELSQNVKGSDEPRITDDYDECPITEKSDERRNAEDSNKRRITEESDERRNTEESDERRNTEDFDGSQLGNLSKLTKKTGEKSFVVVSNNIFRHFYIIRFSSIKY
jgi:hypothetical protein